MGTEMKQKNNNRRLLNSLMVINKIVSIIFLLALIVLGYFLLTQPDKFIDFFDQLINEIKFFFDLIVDGFLLF